METVAAGAVLLMLFAATCVIPVAVAVVALSVVRQGKFRRPGTPVSPLVAEAMTRRAINDARIMIVVSSAVVAALYVTGDECYAVLVAFIHRDPRRPSDPAQQLARGALRPVHRGPTERRARRPDARGACRNLAGLKDRR
jgi:hypothetical protein